MNRRPVFYPHTGKRPVISELLAAKDQPLIIDGNAAAVQAFVRYFLLHRGCSVLRIDFQIEGGPVEQLDHDLHRGCLLPVASLL